MGLVEDNTTYYWKVVASDPDGATTENTGGYHSFSINTGNDQPVAVDMEFETQEDIGFDGILEATDTDGDLLTFNVFYDPETGEVDLDEYVSTIYLSSKKIQKFINDNDLVINKSPDIEIKYDE